MPRFFFGHTDQLIASKSQLSFESGGEPRWERCAPIRKRAARPYDGYSGVDALPECADAYPQLRAQDLAEKIGPDGLAGLA